MHFITDKIGSSFIIKRDEIGIMQVSVITDEIDVDLEHALDVMNEYGVVSAEIRTIWDKNVADAPDEYIDRVKKIVTERGVKVVGIASPFYKCDLAGVESEEPAGSLHDAVVKGYDEQLSVLNRCIEIAKKLDTRYVRVFTFWNKIPLTPEVEDRIVKAYAEPIALAEKEGIVLLIENEHACLTGTGVETARIIAKINSPVVRAIWDPGNAFMAGETTFPDGYEAIKPYVEHVHVKDAKMTEIGKVWTVVGEGECRWEDQIKALKADGYKGFLSLETHYSGHPTKELSSRACLEPLVKFVQNA